VNNYYGSRAELGRVIASGMTKGSDVSATDRTYAAKIVARRTGMSQADAEKRVNDTIAQAKKAADDARKVAAKLSLWLAASMLAGALAASLAATEGGLLRDSPGPVRNGTISALRSLFTQNGSLRCQFSYGCWECRSASSLF